LAPLNNPNDVGEVTGIKGGFAVPMLVEKKDPRIPEFDEVKTKVATAIKDQRSREQFEQRAKDLIASLSGPDAIKAAGEKEGYDTGLEEGFKLGSALGKAGTSPALDELIYSLKPGEFSKTPIKVDDKWVVVGVVKKTDADMKGFAGQQDSLKQSLLSERQNQVFEDYISAVQQRMRRDGKIKIYDQVLAQLDKGEPAAEPNLPGGFNFPTK
jgi:parvulin-like peptidyl-prolyl isomerase